MMTNPENPDLFLLERGETTDGYFPEIVVLLGFHTSDCALCISIFLPLSVLLLGSFSRCIRNFLEFVVHFLSPRCGERDPFFWKAFSENPCEMWPLFHVTSSNLLRIFRLHGGTGSAV